LFSSLSTLFPVGLTALVGKNGTGKSTLLKLITGELLPNSGKVSVTGSFRFFSQDDSSFKTVADAMGVAKYLEGLDRFCKGQIFPEDWAVMDGKWDIESQIAGLLSGSGLDYITLDKPYSVLSGGERIMIRFLGCLATQPDILLLDEPTNHLDSKFRQVVYSTLLNWKKTALVISHDRDLLNIVSSIAELKQGEITWYGGNYSFYKEMEIRQREAISAEHDRSKRELKTLEEQSKAKFENQSKKIVRASKSLPKSGIPKILLGKMKQNAENTLAKTSKVSENKIEEAKLLVVQTKSKMDKKRPIIIDLPEVKIPKGQTIFEATGINHRFEPFPDLWEKPISLNLSGPFRLAITGNNGSGKTVLIKIMTGQIVPSNGEVNKQIRKYGWLDQHYSFKSKVKTVYELAYEIAGTQKTEGEIRIKLGRFGFYKDSVFQNLDSLSGGEKLRVQLACLFLKDPIPQVLILDEPTNNSDLESLEILTTAIKTWKGALIVISHDPHFLSEIGIEQEINLKRAVTKKSAL
ncbi:MAG: ABC-F family ATP-binding cassette domain-containing protein, partial [Bacteroidetes bacterium]|nr:ABC-F family ATP-binding cassette domain-containing protein [Bacteroidota bacterium]